MSLITEMLQRFRMLAGGARVARFGEDINAIAHMFTTTRSATGDVRWLFHLPAGQVDDFLKHWARRNNLSEDIVTTFGVNAQQYRALTAGTAAAQPTLVEGGLRAVRVLDDYPAVAHVNFGMVRDGERVMIDLWFPGAVGGYSGVRANLMSYMMERIRALGGQALSPNLVNLLGGAGQTFRAAPTLR